MTEQEVISHVTQLHANPSAVASANVWLSKFQKQPQAWTVAHAILTTPQAPQGRQLEVLHFCAQTVCAKVQAGVESLGDARAAFKEVIVQLIRVYCAGPAIVLRQLCLALCAYVLHSQDWKDPLPDIVAALTDSPEVYGCLLEFLALLPEELSNQRVLVPSSRRAMFGYHMVTKMQFVFETLYKVLDVARSPQVCWQL